MAALLTGALTLSIIRRTSRGLRRWGDRAALRAIRRFRARLDRYKLVSKRTVRDELLNDDVVLRAVRESARERKVSELDARVRVEAYVDEIVPFFNVLSYYKLGYNLSRVLLQLLYRVTVGGPKRGTLDAIPRRDVVLYLMNHRSNADYVVVAYVLASAVSISYAVGEWARVWPLEYVFKSFGSYFVRRGFRDPLYHTVLERYVQLITRQGVTQGIFLEGGLSRDGCLRPAKIGLLDYIVRTLNDPEFDRDIWLVPVALNYDRVLEDRTLIKELVSQDRRPSRIRQFAGVLNYVFTNLARLVTGNLKRYGRVAVNFGAPFSVRAWVAEHPGILDLPREERLPQIQKLADEAMSRIASIVPVTPVPLAAAALLSFRETVVPRAALLTRLEAYRDHLRQSGTKLIQPDRATADILDRAWRTLSMRRLVVPQGEAYIVLPGQRPLLEYYANSIRHLLPEEDVAVVMHPVHEPDDSLPRLRRWKPRSGDH